MLNRRNLPYDSRCFTNYEKEERSKLEQALDEEIEELEKRRREQHDENDDCPIDIQWDPKNQIFIIDGVAVSPELLKAFVHEGEDPPKAEEEEETVEYDDLLPF